MNTRLHNTVGVARLSVLFVALLTPLLTLGNELPWSRPPFKVKINNSALDVCTGMTRADYEAEINAKRKQSASDAGSSESTLSGTTDLFGHAGPFFGDLSGSGKKDLLLSGFGGFFRLYGNVGSPQLPNFTGDHHFLQVGGILANVPIGCCIAPSPLLVDLDGDGIADLISGSYEPGYIYWFKGLGQGKFDARHALLDEAGLPIVTHPGDANASLGSWAAFVDWDNLGKSDLLVGSFDGRIFLHRRVAGGRGPVFESEGIEIKVNGEKAVPEFHASVAVADWDGDGLWDILVGTDTGAVYFLRNSGKLGHPQFESRVQLIGSGEGYEQWVEPGAEPRRGIRSQIQVVDYNHDGKLDIVLGDWSATMSPKSDLSEKERQEMQTIREQIAELDRAAKFDFTNWRYKAPGYTTEAVNKVSLLQEQLSRYLVHYPNPFDKNEEPSVIQYHGFVWVFLRQ